MQYTVIEAGSTDNLIAHINYLVKRGWEPIGGVCTTNNNMNGRFTYAQAMTTNNMSISSERQKRRE